MSKEDFIAKKLLEGCDCDNCSYQSHRTTFRFEGPEAFCEWSEYKPKTICIYYTKLEDRIDL